MDQYERYARDGEVLAAIGRAIRNAEGTGPVALPLELAQAAVAAWVREEPEEPASPESPGQVHVRRQAAALALIGEEIEKRSDLGSDPVTVQLGAGLIQVAIAAAGYQPEDEAEDQAEDQAAEQPEDEAEDPAAGQAGDAANGPASDA